MQHSIKNKNNLKLKASKLLLLFVFTIAGGLSSVIYSQSVDDLYQAANNLYKANQYDKATIAFEKILMQGYRSAEVYYNLGNCYYKQNNTGKAILNFERARQLAPDDEDIIHNLKLAQLKAVDKLVPVPQLAITSAWKNFTASQSSKGWSTWALIFLWVALLVFSAYLFVVKKSWIALTAMVLLAFSIFTLLLATGQNMAEENSGYAILIVEDVIVKSAPDENGTNLFTVHEGIKLQLLDAVGNWSKVRLADGKVGWIEKNLFEKI